ncbi:hypothetical protein [Mycoplasma sp. P36-A1]|uniref:hypothetical protein n=1 Tax=Mycoplasma sp. P36-A1 TaxID=3252900 RepID=UPI003C2E2BC7
MSYLNILNSIENKYEYGLSDKQFLKDAEKTLQSTKILSLISKLKVKTFDDVNLINQNIMAVIEIITTSKLITKDIENKYLNLLQDKKYRFPYLMALQQQLLNPYKDNFYLVINILQKYDEEYKTNISNYNIVTLLVAYLYNNSEYFIDSNIINHFLKDIESDYYLDSVPTAQNYEIIKEILNDFKQTNPKLNNLDNLTFIYLLKENSNG